MDVMPFCPVCPSNVKIARDFDSPQHIAGNREYITNTGDPVIANRELEKRRLAISKDTILNWQSSLKLMPFEKSFLKSKFN